MSHSKPMIMDNVVVVVVVRFGLFSGMTGA